MKIFYIRLEPFNTLMREMEYFILMMSDHGWGERGETQENQQ